MTLDPTRVKLWQRTMNLLGRTHVSTDGVFGPLSLTGTLATRKYIDPSLKLTREPKTDEDLADLVSAGQTFLKAFALACPPRTLDAGNPYDSLLRAFIQQKKKILVDVSRCQSAVNWDAVKSQNPYIEGAICKATGISVVDSEFEFNCKEILAAGLKLGVYSVINPDAPPGTQTDLLKRALTENACVPSFFLVDFETKHRSSVDVVAANVHEYERAINEFFGASVPVLIYTYPGYIYEFGKKFDDDNFALATYSGQPSPARCQVTKERTYLYQFSGWTSVTLPYVTDAPQSSDKIAGIRLQLRPEQWVPTDFDVILSDEFTNTIFGT